MKIDVADVLRIAQVNKLTADWRRDNAGTVRSDLNLFTYSSCVQVDLNVCTFHVNYRIDCSVHVYKFWYKVVIVDLGLCYLQTRKMSSVTSVRE